MKSTPRLPSTLTPFFQEYDPSRLDVQTDRSVIIERILQFGNRDEIRWLFRVYSRAIIADWARRWGDEALSEPHRSFWQLVLNAAESDG